MHHLKTVYNLLLSQFYWHAFCLVPVQQVEHSWIFLVAVFPLVLGEYSLAELGWLHTQQFDMELQGYEG